MFELTMLFTHVFFVIFILFLYYDLTSKKAVMRVPINSERKAQKLLDVCKYYRLDDQYRAICRVRRPSL